MSWRGKENVIDMTTMSSVSTSRWSPNRARLLGCVLFGALTLLLLNAASAFAAVEWNVRSTHGPENMRPGSVGQYVLLLRNVGDTDADASVDPLIVTDTLPAGVTALTATGLGWTCDGIGTGTVRCESTSLFIRPPGTSAVFRGWAPPIRVTVDVPIGMSGVVDNVVDVSGGGAPSPAATTEPTPFNDAPSLFGVRSFTADGWDGVFPTGSPERQAGSHPVELRVDFAQNLALGHDADSDTYYTEPAGDTKTLETLLPPGMVGDPLVTPRCPAITLNDTGFVDKGACPANTQVGVADFELQDGAELTLSGITGGPDGTTTVPLFNLVPPPGVAAAFGFSVTGSAVWILARVAIDQNGRYTVVARVDNTTQAFRLRSVRLTMWGVPADPIHDPLRQDPTQFDPSFNMGTPFRDAPIRPFLTMPSRCDAAGAAAVQMRVDSWQNPGQFTPWVSGGPLTTMEGCDDPRFRFEPTITVQPESRDAKTPAALDVELSVPQKDATVADATLLYDQSGDDRAIATPPLRSAVVQLPAGVSVSPSSADGLAACTPLQIKLGTVDEPTCPDASKIGSVTIDTPLLAEQLRGDVFFAAQNDNPFNTMLAIYIVARGPGAVIKLPGKVEPGPDGRLTTTFDNNPELPFSRMRLHFLGGPRAPLAMPTACGRYTSTGQLASWNGSLPAVQAADSFVIDRNCTRTFDPGFTAGTTNPVAGKDSTVVTRFTRSDDDEELSKVDVTLPLGVLGRIADVELCADGPANAGTCGEASRIGTISVGAGPGPNPFFITNGRAYMTGPYKGAPFGMSFVVPAKAGPIDLGNVIVRAAVDVNRLNAQLRVVSDPLPTI
ncbi:MAG TPA: hypothetical protein VK506_00705, partial [Conexibacter sp.]|nr:hypothetical protein [Conexibacter sp.]